MEPLTVFEMLSRVVFPAAALGNRVRALTREVRASVRHRKMNSSSFKREAQKGSQLRRVAENEQVDYK
jgi:hypothetical protein